MPPPRKPPPRSLSSPTRSSRSKTGRIRIEKINEPFLYNERGTPAECGAGLKLAIERGWLWMHESGTYVKITQVGADLFA
jgi:hypothetical protein